VSGWVYIAIFIGLLLAVGLVTDWRRRHSTGGVTGNRPYDARRSAQAGEAEATRGSAG
jgi:nitrogen fixation protein FixH